MMNVLIVDDEKHVRDAVKMIVDWERLGFAPPLEAEDGEEAMNVITDKQPQLVITDMRMPRADGSRLLAWIHRHAPDSKIIVVSGHDDFHYMQSTVRYGGLDYILKPIEFDTLNSAVQKAVDSLQSEQRQKYWEERRRRQINQLKPVYWEKLFSGLLNPGEDTHLDLHDVRFPFGLAPDIAECRVAILSLDWLVPPIDKAFGNHRGLLTFAVTNIANEILQQHHAGFAFRNWNIPGEIVIIVWRQTDRSEDFLGQINDGMAQSLKGRMDIGLGETVRFPKDVSVSYEQAKTALGGHTMRRKSNWVHLYKAGTTVPPSQTVFLSDYEETWRAAVYSARSDIVAKAVDEWMERIDQISHLTRSHLKAWREEYDQLVHRWLQDENGQATDVTRSNHRDLIWNVPVDDLGNLMTELWKANLEQALTVLAERLEQKQRGTSIIDDICAYIRKHLDEPLSLQTISDRFYLSREYISRKFKQEKGINLTDYITSCRMEKAMTLLMNPRLKITQIAVMTGYQDEKYFSKVFKKTTGMSPNDYRKHA